MIAILELFFLLPRQQSYRMLFLLLWELSFTNLGTLLYVFSLSTLLINFRVTCTTLQVSLFALLLWGFASIAALRHFLFLMSSRINIIGTIPLSILILYSHILNSIGILHSRLLCNLNLCLLYYTLSSFILASNSFTYTSNFTSHTVL